MEIELYRKRKLIIQVMFYKSIYLRFSFKDLIPVLNFSQNVQGYSFISDYVVTWLRYCVRLCVTKRYVYFDYNLPREPTSLNIDSNGVDE